MPADLEAPQISDGVGLVDRRQRDGCADGFDVSSRLPNGFAASVEGWHRDRQSVLAHLLEQTGVGEPATLAAFVEPILEGVDRCEIVYVGLFKSRTDALWCKAPLP